MSTPKQPVLPASRAGLGSIVVADAGNTKTQIISNVGAVTAIAATQSYSLAAVHGSYALTGEAAVIDSSNAITAVHGSYALTGEAATLGIGLTAAQGSYTLTGHAATLAEHAYTLLAVHGAYALTGEPSAFPFSRTMPGSHAAYALTGEAASFTLDRFRTIMAAHGSYALTGEAQSFRVRLAVAASAGAYSLRGQSAVLRKASAVSVSDLTFYFAWVDQSNTTYDPSYARWDENVFSFEIDHQEGQIPTMKLVVKNPRIGFIAPGRLYWAWFSYSPDGGANLCPLFFGRLVGIPTSILENTVEMQFIARAANFIKQKQLAAEALKTSPNYDPIFVSVEKRDDPDTILEGWSSLYHIDRVTLAVTASDILVGEDGTVSFQTIDTFYDSVKMKLLQSPLIAVNVKAEVSWQQQFRDWFNVGQWTWPTLGGEPVVQQWPQSGSSLGSGWFAGVSWAGERDPSAAASVAAVMPGSSMSVSYSYKNLRKYHGISDVMSIDASLTTPAVAGGGAATISSHIQIGEQNPYACDAGGNPTPINTPYHYDYSYVTWRTFDIHYLGKSVAMYFSLVYEANRKRTERVDITVKADVQPILIDPLVTEDTENITLKSGDLTIPMINLLNWDSVSGQAVALGQIIFPDNPLVAGQTTSQVCVQAGTAGSGDEPVFSNIPGVTTTDNTVVWSSLGVTSPTEGAQDWQRMALVGIGTILLPKPISGAPDIVSMEAAGAMSIPPTGIAVALFTVFTKGEGGPGAPMLECNHSGIAGGITTNQATFQEFTNPSGQYLHICIQAGLTSQFHPTWNETPGAITNDGSVKWQCVGQVSLAIGGWPGMTPSPYYFPTNRGLQSLEHLMCRARAKLRKRARAVQIDADVRFEAATGLSCRMNASIQDLRLPGGQAAGKVVGYRLSGDGATGVVIGHVTMGCSIGNANAITTNAGSPTYAADGYMAAGYQYYSGATIGVGGISDEIGYTPPVPGIVDDGLTFPVSPSDVILQNAWHGDQAAVDGASQAVYNAIVREAIINSLSTHTTGFDLLVPGSVEVSETITVSMPDWSAVMTAAIQASAGALLQGQALWYELVLKPMTGGPYMGAYVVDPTALMIPQTINLSAPSSGG